MRPGAPIHAIGRAIQSYAEGEGFSVVRTFVGHGIGEEFHTSPSVPHYYDPHAERDHDAGHDVHHRADDQRRHVASSAGSGATAGPRRRPTARRRRSSSTRCWSRATGVEVLTLEAGRAARQLALRSIAGDATWRGSGRSSPVRPPASARRSRRRFAAEGAAVCVTVATRPDAARRSWRGDRRRGRPRRVHTGCTRRRRRAAMQLVAGAVAGARRSDRAREQRGGRRRRRRARGDVSDRSLGRDPARRSHRAVPLCVPGRDPAHARRRSRGDREHLDPPGRAGEQGVRRLHRGQGGHERAHARRSRSTTPSTASGATRSAPATC